MLRASQIAGGEAMSGFLAIVNAAPSDYEKLTKAVENSNGAAQEMADVMQNNLQGEMTKLQSATEGLGIAAYDKFGNVFKNRKCHLHKRTRNGKYFETKTRFT